MSVGYSDRGRSHLFIHGPEFRYRIPQRLPLTFFYATALRDRCTRHMAEIAVMCTPDFEPVYEFLVSGVRDMGFMVNTKN